jgi:hypothetical protein
MTSSARGCCLFGLAGSLGVGLLGQVSDYVVKVIRHGQPPIWAWEIQRLSKPLGVRLYDGGFKSEGAARLAGEKALVELLDRMAQEGN